MMCGLCERRCCYGTGVEAYASLANGVAYHDATNGLWMVGYIYTTITWAAQGLTCRRPAGTPTQAPSP